MANRQTQGEREYQDSLKITQSMLGEISRAMADTANSTDGRNRALEQQLDITRDILNSIGDIKDYEKTINQLLAQQTQINNTNYGINERLRQVQLAQLDAALGILRAGEDTEKVFRRVNDITSETTDKFSSGIDTILTKLEDIPIVGKALKNFFQPFADSAKSIINKTVDKFTKGFTTSFTSARAGGASFTNSLREGLSGGVKGMSSMIGTVGRLLAAINPVVLAVIAIGLATYAGFKRFEELESAAKAFREETGLLNSQTAYLRNNIKDVSTEFAGLGVSADDASKAAAAFSNELAPSEQISKATLGSMVTLNKNFGIGVSEAAELNKVFQNIGGLTQEQSQALIGQTAEMAKLAGVAPAKVIQDMAESSEYAYRYFNGSPKELAKAAVEAAKLGTSIKQAGEMADGLLDFENSITAELEASAMLGTNLNLSQARYLAANNDILGAQQEVLNQVASLGDLTKLNKFEQEALTKATGMQMGDLINQQRIRERFGKLDSEQLAAATSLIESGKDISKLNTQDLQAQTKRLANQKEMQSVMENLSNEGGAISTAFQDMFEPFAANLMPFITDVVSMVSGVLVPTFRLLGSVLKVVLAPLGFMLSIIGSIGKTIINFLVTPIKFVVNIVNSIYELFSSLVNDGLSGFVSKIQEIGPLMTGIATTVGIIASAFLVSIVPSIITFGIALVSTVVPALIAAVTSTITWAISMAAAAIAAISTASAMTLGIGALAIAGGIAAGAMAMKSGTDSAASSVESIDDGVVQDGKVVSTNPVDTIFAMKKPEDLANSASTIQTTPTIDISALVTKMDEMIQAVSANRDVYMDKEKVSSAVTRTSEKSSENRFGLMGA